MRLTITSFSHRARNQSLSLVCTSALRLFNLSGCISLCLDGLLLLPCFFTCNNAHTDSPVSILELKIRQFFKLKYCKWYATKLIISNRCPRMSGADTPVRRMTRFHAGGCEAAATSRRWGRWMMKVVTLTLALKLPRRRLFAPMHLSSNQPCKEHIWTRTGRLTKQASPLETWLKSQCVKVCMREEF